MRKTRPYLNPKVVFGVYYGIEACLLIALFILTFVYAGRTFDDANIILRFNLYEIELIEKASQLRRFFFVGLLISLMNGSMAVLIIKYKVFQVKANTFVSNWLHFSTILILVFILIHIYHIISVNI